MASPNCHPAALFISLRIFSRAERRLSSGNRGHVSPRSLPLLGLKPLDRAAEGGALAPDGRGLLLGQAGRDELKAPARMPWRHVGRVSDPVRRGIERRHRLNQSRQPAG